MAVIAPVGGGLVSDIINWVRRIIKIPSTQSISDAVISDYINRFMTYDLPERIQLFEMKRQYVFETIPNIFQYQAPFIPATTAIFPGGSAQPAPPFLSGTTSTTTQSQTIVPVYQMFKPPVYVDRVEIGWFQSNDQFYQVFPEFVNNEVPILGDGTAGPFTLTVADNPILRGFIDDLGYLTPYVFITTVNAAGQQQYIVDSGYTDTSGNGLLIQVDASLQNIIGPVLTGTPPNAGGSGTINYSTGVATFTFNSNTVSGANIQTQTTPFSAGAPRVCLFFNNFFKLYPVPDRAYKIQIDAYMTPTVFLNTTSAVPFAYMSEYIARGASQKILSDNGDYEQFQFYEPLFREQENFVLRRSDRQRAVQRTPTIFSGQTNNYTQQGYTQY